MTAAARSIAAGGTSPPTHIRDLRLERDVERLCQLGPRPILELLQEIGAARNILTFVEDRAAVYANLDPARLAVVGGDRLPPLPIHEVQK